MSTIVIPNGKFPSNCFSCDYEHLVENCPCRIGICSASEYKDSRHSDCPIKEIPEPYGRLGDLDILEKQAISEAYFPSEEWATVIELIKDAHTILEASE